MKKKWFGLGCLTSFVILILVVFLLFNYLANIGKKEIKVSENSVLNLELRGTITEYNELSKTAFAQEISGAHEIIRKIEAAAIDPRIKAILLQPNYVSAGYATCNEIIAALSNFQKNGKKVYAYLESAMDKDYYLAAVADEVYLNPSASAGLILTGFSANINYYKNLLDKIGVDVKVLHAGQFKGTYENFSRSTMSPALRENLEQLIANMYDNTLKNIALNRGIDKQQVYDLYEKRDNLFINQQTALDSGLIDQLLTLPELYYKLNLTENNLITYNVYPISNKKVVNNQKVAVVYLNGNIMPSAGGFSLNTLNLSKLDEILDNVEQNPRVKAVVLRVNSPGGSSMEAKLMLDRINKLNKNLPVVVSFANVAASGGYQISAQSDYIFADKNSLTGSIGVVGMLPNISELTQKLGIKPEVIKKGKYADFYNPLTEFDPNFVNSMENSMNEIYIEFKQIVANGRNISYDDMEKRAQGRVFTASKALELNLVDEIGNLQQAVDKAASLAGIKSYNEEYYPRKKSMMEIIYENIFNKKMMASMSRSKLEMQIDKSLEFYEQIQAEPIQNLMLWKIGSNNPRK